MLPVDVHDRLYNIINVTAVTSLLDGGIVKGKPPLNELKKWISIMSSSMDDDFPQECIASIVIYVPNFDNGMKDATPFNAISRAVKSELDNYVQTEDKYFQFLRVLHSRKQLKSAVYINGMAQFSLFRRAELLKGAQVIRPNASTQVILCI